MVSPAGPSDLLSADRQVDAEQLMAPPLDPNKIKSLTKNPYAADIIEKDVQLLKLKKARMEEEE